MSKRSLTKRSAHLQDSQGKKHMEEHSISITENFMPSPEELQKYAEFRPDIVDTIIKAAQKEQDLRHEFARANISLMKKDQNYAFTNSMFGMFCAFILLMALFTLTGYLLYNDKNIEGSLFGIGSITATITLFISKHRRK